MPDTVKNPVSDVYKRWSAEVKKVVGDGNYSFERSQTLAANKKMYAQMFLMGNPGTRWDIEGDEVATIPSFQIVLQQEQKVLKRYIRLMMQVTEQWCLWDFNEHMDQNSKITQTTV